MANSEQGKFNLDLSASRNDGQVYKPLIEKLGKLVKVTHPDREGAIQRFKSKIAQTQNPKR